MTIERKITVAALVWRYFKQFRLTFNDVTELLEYLDGAVKLRRTMLEHSPNDAKSWDPNTKFQDVGDHYITDDLFNDLISSLSFISNHPLGEDDSFMEIVRSFERAAEISEYPEAYAK